MIYSASVKQEQPMDGTPSWKAWQHSEEGRGRESACDHTHNPRSESDETSQYNENKLSRSDQ